MKQSIVIAQAGTGNYRLTPYQSAETGNVFKTNYSFEAVVKNVLLETAPDQMQIVLVGSKDSNLGSVYQAFSQNPNEDLFQPLPLELAGENREKVKNLSSEEVQHLFEALMTNVFSDYFKGDVLSKDISDRTPCEISMKLAVIKYGTTEEELQENFTIIKDTVEDVLDYRRTGRDSGSDSNSDSDKDMVDIYFDISNGFRSFPIYIYTLINYLSQIQDYNVRFHMYYGMYEYTRAEEKNDVYDEGNTPLVDLRIIDDMMSLIRGISEFRSCGSVVQIRKLLEQNPGWNVQIGEKEEETLSYAFNLFDYGTNANNLAEIKNAIELLTGMEDRLKTAQSVNVAERMLLDDISRDFRERFDTARYSCPYSVLIIRLAEWYHMQGREGNAAIAAQETILTYMLERYPDEVNDYLRINAPKDYPKEGTIDFSKPENLFCYSFRNPVKNLMDAFNPHEDDDMFDFLTTYKSVKKNIRNVMAHILLSERNGKDDEFCANDVNDYRNTIRKLIQKVKGEVENQEKVFGEWLKERLSCETNIQKEREEKIKRLGNMLDSLNVTENFVEKTAENDDFTKNLSALREQIKVMSQAKDFQSFYQKREGELKLLFCIMDAWIRSDGKNPSENTYSIYFSQKKDKKGNERKGYERLVNYIATHKAKVVGILDKFRTENISS
ncbi:MAG: hypothetical protein LUE14_07050 [Clostridiales bacterium]|nr:hypothetical protein [Clostridiales bacterium]